MINKLKQMIFRKKYLIDSSKIKVQVSNDYLKNDKRLKILEEKVSILIGIDINKGGITILGDIK